MLTNAANIAAVLGRTFTPTEDARADALAALAQTEVENRVGRPLEFAADVVETITALPGSPKLLLDYWPVTSITSITDNGVAVAAGVGGYFVELPTGIVRRAAYWSTVDDGVIVTYRPADVTQLTPLITRIAARAFTVGEAAAGVPEIARPYRQLTIGRWSMTRGAESTTPGDALQLTEADRAEADRWRDRLP